MRRLIALALGLVVCVLGAAARDSDPAFTEPFVRAQVMSTQRIINGSVAVAGSFPMAIQMGVVGPGQPRAATGGQEAFFCGGSLIAPRWVLTAAHCVIGPTGQTLANDQLLLRASFRRGEGGRAFHAVKIVPHEHYVTGTESEVTRNDIALVELAEPAGLPTATLMGAAYAPALLAPTQDALTVVGWGVTESGSNTPADVLLHVDLDLIDKRTCAQVYGHYPTDGSQICAGEADRCTSDGHCSDACQGDSGGPLFARRPSGLIQAGIVSYGVECGTRRFPGVYTSVAFYETWIKDHVPDSHFAEPPLVHFAPVDEVLSVVAPRPVPSRPSSGPAVTISLAGGDRFKIGSTLTLTLVSNVPGRLLLFNQDERGIGRLKVPNTLSRRVGRDRERVVAGESVEIPDQYRDPYQLGVVGPPGRSRLVAVVVPEGSAVEPIISRYLNGGEITDMEAWMRELASRLPKGEIAFGEADYDIVP